MKPKQILSSIIRIKKFIAKHDSPAKSIYNKWYNSQIYARSNEFQTQNEDVRRIILHYKNAEWDSHILADLQYPEIRKFWADLIHDCRFINIFRDIEKMKRDVKEFDDAQHTQYYNWI